MWRQLYLLRHGETEWNTQKRFRGRAEIGLSERGRRQARAAAVRLKEISPSILVISPLRRCRETASILTEETGAEVVECSELIDPDTGDWTGMEVGEVRKNFPGLFKQMNETPSRFRFPHGESVAEVEKRVRRFLYEKADEFDEETIVAVTHNFICQVATLCALECSMDNIFRIEQDHCALTLLMRRGKRIALSKFNENYYLEGI